MTVDCNKCRHNMPYQNPAWGDFCNKNVLGFPSVKNYCRFYETEGDGAKIIVPLVQKEKIEEYNKAVHLQQYVNEKKKDILFFYIYLP